MAQALKRAATVRFRATNLLPTVKVGASGTSTNVRRCELVRSSVSPSDTTSSSTSGCAAASAASVIGQAACHCCEMAAVSRLTKLLAAIRCTYVMHVADSRASAAISDHQLCLTSP